MAVHLVACLVTGTMKQTYSSVKWCNKRTVHNRIALMYTLFNSIAFAFKQNDKIMAYSTESCNQWYIMNHSGGE